MAGKNPAALWYFNDWEKDLAKHPHEIGGAWMLILCELHWHDGDLTQTWTEWSKVLRVSVAKTKRIISVLDQKRIGNITKVPGNRGGVRIVSRRMVNDSKKREANRIRQKEWYHKKDKPNADLTTIQQKPNTPFPVPVPVPVTNKNNNNPPISPLGDRVMASWNEHMSSNKIRVLGKGREKAIKRNLELDPEWGEKYLKAAPMFPGVDDSDWPGGKFTFDFTLRIYTPQREFSPVVDRVLSGVYSRKRKAEKTQTVGRHPGDCGTEAQETPKNTRSSPQAKKAISEALRKVASNTGQI